MPDERNIHIDKVGIKDLRLPVVVQDRAHGTQHTVADVNFYVDLPHQFKGTHMSRFVEILNDYRESFEISRMDEILATARTNLNAVKAHLELTFPYFIEKKAPVSKAPGMIDYFCTISAAGNGNRKVSITLTVRVPVTSLCPCSKEISDYGAHNQRSIVTVSVMTSKFIWLEELIDVVEEQASCEVYSLLKREDEKFVTEKAYNNPVFVEDIVRGITDVLSKDSRIDWFSVESDNIESIHNHNAYASIARNLKAEREETQKLAGSSVRDEDVVARK
ncbi:MAG: GTP cyclohydrolase I FolE2 [candidate division Zixibacteria bacterium]|nr:GTP cyclohydrolase I FolE2 [candidate division Zixibacteria bacterium]MBU1470906.1 GTP cyclohydrolase I FolE2 [candidate division Zixibacteria bacterium]MBU2624284.1 GTP cyclohydrolase I FolE2 [candidate division Zixibacteria bacterium]